ncbi:hypothetical protein SH467x_003987 [Pirellulaceae bacterium SH467]
MKHIARGIIVFLFMLGIIVFVYLTNENIRLSAEVGQLEAELGKMEIDDASLVYLAEVASPDVPKEVADHLLGIWQFRCYLPPNYDFIKWNGGGNISEDGIFHRGGSGSSWGTPRKEAIHHLLTISMQKQGERILVFYSFQGSNGTTSWSNLSSDRVDQLRVQKLVRSERGPRSFDSNTILPILRIFDPQSANEQNVGGETIKTFAGGQFILSPKSREREFNLLLRGESIPDFDPSWLAQVEQDDE